MSIEQIIAMLWREPFNHTLEEIGNLTSDQLVSLTRKDPGQTVKENDDGSVVTGGYPRLTFEQYAATWKSCGKTDAWIEAEWQQEYGQGAGDG